MKLADDALEQVGRLFKENAELRKRAGKAEAALAELRERLGALRVERGYGPRSTGVTVASSPTHAREVAERRGQQVWIRIAGEWLPANTPHTALEHAALGFVETEQRFVTLDGRETAFDLHNEDDCGCRREERDLYAGPWRGAVERAAEEQGVQPVGDAARQGEGGT